MLRGTNWAFSIAVAGLLLPLLNVEVQGQSILFRNSKATFIPPEPDLIPGYWDHVALEFGGDVWESHPGYSKYNYFGTPQAWDPDTSQRVWVDNISGVQRQHHPGSFWWNSSSTSSSPTENHARLFIDSSLASLMNSEAMQTQGGFINLLNPLNISNLNQKGAGGSFSCVGLVEHLAEAVGYHAGQGFVPNDREYVNVAGYPAVFALTPDLLHAAITQNWQPNDGKRNLVGLFDPVDFLITDFLGRRTGFTAGTGYLNEIPGMTYGGDGTWEQVILANPPPGDYHVHLIGLGQNTTVAVGDGSGAGFYYSGFLAAGATVDGAFTVPEPTTTSLLLVPCLLGRRRRNEV